MTFIVTCPHCGQSCRTGQGAIGENHRCENPECGQSFQVVRAISRAERRVRWLFLGLVLISYAVSLFLPALNRTSSVGGPGEPQEFLPGWTALVLSITLFWVRAWAANLLLWFGLYRFHKGEYGRATILASTAVLLGTIWLWITLFDDDRQTILGSGYWLWLVSMTLLIVGAQMARRVGKQS